MEFVMKKLKLYVGAALLSLLAGCGGGGGVDTNENNAFSNPGQPVFELLATRTSLPVNSAAIPFSVGSEFSQQVDIRALQREGLPIPDLTLIFLQSSDEAVLSVTSGCAQAIGGRARFFVNSGTRTGTAVLTASVVFPYLPGTIENNRCTQTFRPESVTFKKDFPFQVTNTTVRLLELRAQRITLPPNTGRLPPGIGSPFISEVEIIRRDERGLLTDGEFALSVNPTPALPGGISILDDPATEANEFTQIFAQRSVRTNAGRAVVFFHAGIIPGNFTLNVRDLASGVQDQITFTIVQNNTGQISNVRLISDGRPVYIRGANANTDYPIQVLALDGAGLPAADSSGANNVQLEILNPANGGGESLSSAGVLEGTTVRIRTTVGVAQATYRAGSRSGLVTVRATVDRADNNVDNGLQNPVSTQDSFVVGDGQLFSLTLSSPELAALESFPTDPSVVATAFNSTQQPPVNADNPPTPDGTYTLLISAKGVDRFGNPVLAGTAIQFGTFDEPSSGYPESGSGSFLIAGNDGDPQEGGSLFTSLGGNFTTIAGGVGPGDTLVVLGKGDPRNRDLESSRTVARVNSSTSLSIQNRFNFNDDSGASQNFGGVLPYIVGKSTSGSIQAQAFTNASGVALTTLTYPVSRINKSVVVWGRGQGDLVNGSPETISDVDRFVYPGTVGRSLDGTSSIGTLNASPQNIAGSRSSQVFVCARDGNGSPIPGIEIGFTSQAAGTGSAVRIDGQTQAGRLLRRTNRGGCTSGTVDPAGVVAPGVTVRFTAGSSVRSNDVLVGGGTGLILQALPTVLGGGGGRVLLRLIDGGGVPQPGVQVSVICSAGSGGGGGGSGAVSVLAQPGITNTNGETFSDVLGIGLDGVGSARNGNCRFTAGSAVADVLLLGTDACTIPVSPRPAGCPTAPGANTGSGSSTPRVILGITIDNTGAAVGVVTSDTGSIECGTAGQSRCATSVTAGTVVRLRADAGANTQFCGWSGGSDCASGANAINVTVDQNRTCAARFRTGACN